MRENLIKVFNQAKADELSKLGFKYVSEIVNGKTVYSFFVSEEIMNYVNSKFNKKDFFLSNKLTF
ncbi:hypothetical protein [Clostridium sp. 3-3]|uniref:hypothetical protein n=1 Tax=Clostridium sp. 3-3 TaxID=2070757 RepID=UPI000CDB2E3B|nr:hypothetical protein [Clostridium sp. 3-3]POO87880.1 hypothetical protein C1H59_03695 [Clostridium sp. 3-3]